MAKSRSPRADTRSELAELRAAVEQLSQHVHVLRLAIDELTEEVQWRNNQLRDSERSPPPPFVLHSMPRDPTTPDWKINQVLPARASPEAEPAHPARQTLFD